jgi:ABC-type nitrate/sulfonate/bicarbonate transport system substrate-binding protein
MRLVTSCRFLLFFLVLFAALSPAEAQQLRKVNAAIPAITPAAAPFAIAKDRGFYREEGLDVDLIVMPSAVGIQALIGGNVNFSTQRRAGLLPALRAADPVARAYRRPDVLALRTAGDSIRRGT